MPPGTPPSNTCNMQCIIRNIDNNAGLLSRACCVLSRTSRTRASLCPNLPLPFVDLFIFHSCVSLHAHSRMSFPLQYCFCFVDRLPLRRSFFFSRNREGYIETVRGAAKKSRNPYLSLMWTEGGAQPALEEATGLTFGYPAVIAISVEKKASTFFFFFAQTCPVY